MCVCVCVSDNVCVCVCGEVVHQSAIIRLMKPFSVRMQNFKTESVRERDRLNGNIVKYVARGSLVRVTLRHGEGAGVCVCVWKGSVVFVVAVSH